eukprot:Tbor_TRINITY_DN5137_c1_g1::TRINITY_DN5137_c1_g1_i1::g.25579::m.25579/K09489/HSPA4; heat shock 70kDa protein 4
MSVFGLDLGTLYSTVAITRNGGVDVVINEVSKRETATVVSLTDQERCIGETGLDRSVRNMNNTVSYVKHLIGMRTTDDNFEMEKRFLTCETTEDENKRVKFAVSCHGEDAELYPEQVLAMFLRKIASYVNLECTTDPKYPADVRDCVITVPCFYSGEQRRLVQQACDIAGLNCLSLINEITSAATEYGIFRGASLPETEEEAQTVVIIDVGCGHTSASAFRFWKGNMKVLGHVYDPMIGAREVDYLLFEHFAGLIQKQYGIDIKGNKRARLRVLQGVNRTKQMLSANSAAPFNIENLMDIDININSFTRDEMEEIIAPMMVRYETMMQRLIEKCELDVPNLNSVEMIGGGCRIGIFKRTTEKIFSRPPSFTVNASEAVARGAAITAAVFSPKFQVREFVVNERPLLPILVGHANPGCDKAPSVSFLPNVNDVVPLLGEKDYFPKVLDVTIKRTDAFVLHAFYDENAPDAKTICKSQFRLGEWHIGAAGGESDGVVKVRVRLLPNGLVSCDSAYTHQTTETEVEVEKENEKGDIVMVKEMKKKKMRIALSCTPQHVLGHTSEVVLRCREAEEKMHSIDVKILMIKEIKNNLEAYIFENRPRLDKNGMLGEYVTDEERTAFLKDANETEEWMYNECSEGPYEEYEKRLNSLKAIGDPAMARYRIRDDMPFNHKTFTDRVRAIQTNVKDKKSCAPDHILPEEYDSAIAKCDEILKTVDTAVTEAMSKPKHLPLDFKTVLFDEKINETSVFCNKIINKPRPKPKVESPAKEQTNGTAKPQENGEQAAAETPAPKDDSECPEKEAEGATAN